ncbi:MAG: hypothetical protein U5L00_12520 [Desulfovermiculus sp.]|nr:hypothetical protein [Desulfovermiculus sp.]
MTAMYSSSEVSLSSEQERELMNEFIQQEGFGQYLLDFFSLDWGKKTICPWPGGSAWCSRTRPSR